MKVRIVRGEMVPYYVISMTNGTEYELPEQIVERYRAADAEFSAAWESMGMAMGDIREH